MRALEEQPKIDRAIWQMERTGIQVDAAFCAASLEKAAADELALWSKMAAELGADRTTAIFGKPHLFKDTDESSGESNKQLAVLLHDELGLPRSPYWKKGKVKGDDVKLDATALEWISGRCPHNSANRRILDSLLDLRKTRGSIKYLRKLPTFINPTTGRVHPVFGAASDADDRVGAVTGRLACKNPELQQIPKDKRKDRYQIRKAFTAAPGNILIDCDFTALEVALLGHLCAKLFGDFDLLESSKPGAPDVHSYHAIKIFRDMLGYEKLQGVEVDQLKSHPDPAVALYRELLKAVFYGLMYGKGAYGFGTSLLGADGLPIGEERAQEVLDALYLLRPGIKKYQDFIADYVRQHRSIKSMSGRRADLSHLVPGDKWAEAKAVRKALNYPMQAGGADVVGTATYRCAFSPFLTKLGCKLVLQVHDALMFECPEATAGEALAEISRIMVEAGQHWNLLATLQAPGHIGRNWHECK